MRRVRLARLADGRRYIVQQVDFRSDIVHTWGEVVAVRGKTTSHAGAKSFALGDVTIAEAAKTDVLLAELFDQARAAVRSGELAGYRA